MIYHNALIGDQKWNLKKARKKQKLYSFTIASITSFDHMHALFKSIYLPRIMNNSIYERNIFVQILLRITFLLVNIDSKKFLEIQDATAI